MKPEDITAWALDELSPEQRRELEQQLAQQPEQQGEADATQAFCDFLQSELGGEATDESLSEDQRARLAALPASPTPAAPHAEIPAPRSWIHRAARPLGVAAVIGLAGLLAWQNLLQPEASLPTSEDEVLRSTPISGGTLTATPKEATELHRLDSESEMLLAEAAQAKPASQIQTPRPEAKPARGMTVVESGAATAADSMADPLPAPAAAPIATSRSAAPQSASAPPMLNVRRTSTPDSSALAKELSDQIVPAQDGLAPGEAKASPLFGRKAAPVDAFADPFFEEPANESYGPVEENPLTAVREEPLSTFSIDVDTASYANTRRFLTRNQLPPPAAVRVEELINYFPYDLAGPGPDDKHPFATHVDIADCPWNDRHRLARVALKGRELGQERLPSHLVFLIDVSGSMNSPDKLPLVQESLRLLVKQLGEEDHVSLVTYSGSSGLVLEPTSGARKGRILKAVDRLAAGGSTHGSAGIQLAYDQAREHFIEGGVNRVILCTDGDFNVGISSPDQLHDLIAKKAESGVFLSVLGFGTGNLKDHTMETLADRGNGNYGYVDSLSEARKLLVEQMQGTLVTIAKDVKIQIEFNPAEVSHYRLIGYSNRLLEAEDFNNDKKDAGEIGAGHAVTALYEVVPAGASVGGGDRPTVDPLRYQDTEPPALRPVAESSGEMMTVKVRYKQPDGDVSQLIETPVTDSEESLAAQDTAFRFATAVACFGMKLRNADLTQEMDWSAIHDLAEKALGEDPFGYRREFLKLVDRAQVLTRDRRP